LNVSVSFLVINCICQLCVVFKDTRRRADRKQTKPRKRCAPGTTLQQRQAAFVELKRQLRQLRDDLMSDRNALENIMDETRETVIKQQQKIRELEYQVQYLQRLSGRSRQGIRLMIDGLNLLCERIQKTAAEEEMVEEQEQEQNRYC